MEGRRRRRRRMGFMGWKDVGNQPGLLPAAREESVLRSMQKLQLQCAVTIAFPWEEGEEARRRGGEESPIRVNEG